MKSLLTRALITCLAVATATALAGCFDIVL